MDARRLRFAAALVLFLAWVAALGTMAFLSGRRPALRPRAAASQGHSSVLAPGVVSPGSSAARFPDASRPGGIAPNPGRSPSSR